MIESKRLPALPLILLGAIATFTGHAAENAAAARIGEAIDESDRARFPGNTHPSAISRNDEGPVEPDYPMAGVRLLLRRSPQQESALKLLMAQQADPKSANFHHWLSPDEFGTRFGPSDADLATLSRWLGSQGLTVTDVNKGRTFMQFSGTASAVGQAFRMEMHHYLVKGQAHIANNGDPSIPAALTPVVGGIASLSDFHAKPLHHDLGTVKRNPATGRWVSPTVAASRQTGTQFTLDGMYGYELVAPLDFATIYNILPLWNAGIDGTGQTIAIAGRSDISLSDVATFRAAFGLPVNVPRVIVNGADPGVPTWGDKVENTLDVEWSGAVAKGAQIIFVTSASTFMDGAQESAQYIIENRTAPIMSFSYGLCELEMGSAGNAAYNALWQQAAAEGIAVFVAAGDTSSAGCDFGGYPSYGAQQGVAVSGTASTPYNTAVGGTDFNALNLQSTSYWSNGGPQYGATALQYIPEVPWNDTCTSLAYLTSLGVLAGGQDAEQYCNAMLEQGKYLASLTTIGGAGGVSACTTPGTGAASSCTGGYLKPSWQTGLGVPADGHRDMPDVALFAGAGMLQTAFVMCIASSAHPCDYANSTDAMAQAVGGTSVSSPAMAGIMAMVNQKMGTPQGSANASLYALAARDNRANCNTVTVGTGNACNFYDITTGGNAVPCVAGSLNCVVTHQGDQLGILSGYQAGVGYDLATGLGSVNAANLVNNWHLAGSAVSQVTVPNAVGSTQIAATTALNLADLGLGTVARQNSTSVASGSVISQNPVAGALVASGTNVALVVSSGAPIVLPNEVGLTQAAATASLKGIGALLGTISNTPNGCYTTGTVTSQSPAAGTVISGGASVSLVIAAAAPRVAVPNMSGVPTAFASTILANRGLNTGAITQVSSTAYDSGIVVGESPAAGTSVAACSSVSLLVSSGPPTVTVPSTVGLTQTAATNVLFSVGFGIVVTQQASATVAAGKVLSETPAAGSKIAPGSPVHLVISSGPSLIKVPNAVGLTQAAASTLLTSKSLVLGAVTLQTSTSVAAGFVISELPAAGTASAAGSKVALIVSRGRT